jgi:hypothetical protein
MLLLGVHDLQFSRCWVAVEDQEPEARQSHYFMPAGAECASNKVTINKGGCEVLDSKAIT